MGNAISVTTQNHFYTSCMAKYTNITKPQVMAIRNLLVLLSQQQSSGGHTKSPTTTFNDRPTMIERKHLLKAIQKVNLAKDPDHDIIDLIFTMWCRYNDDDVDDVNKLETEGPVDKTKSTPSSKPYKQVPWYEFLISISLLACKTDTFEQSIRFTLYVVHRNHFYHSTNQNTTASTNPTQQGYISSSDAVSFLQGLCTTAAFYGDKHLLQNEQINEVVDRIYDSITKVTFENVDDNSIKQKDLSFDEFVKALLRQQVIRTIVVLPILPKQGRMLKSKQNKKSIDPLDSTPTTASRFGSPIVRKSAMKLTSIYDFNHSRDDESSVKIHFPNSPKSPKSQFNDKNTNKYMPLIDEIEKDARKKLKHTSPKANNAPLVVTTSSSNDNIDAIDPNSIHVTTTEDDSNNDENSLQDGYDDASVTKSDEENVKDDAILATLKANSKIPSTPSNTLKQLLPSTTKNSRHHTSSNSNIMSNNLHSMVLETSETATSPTTESVQSTDLSSHMSSVMLKPLARVRVSNHHYSHRV